MKVTIYDPYGRPLPQQVAGFEIRHLPAPADEPGGCHAVGQMERAGDNWGSDWGGLLVARITTKDVK